MTNGLPPQPSPWERNQYSHQHGSFLVRNTEARFHKSRHLSLHQSVNSAAVSQDRGAALTLTPHHSAEEEDTESPQREVSAQSHPDPTSSRSSAGLPASFPASPMQLSGAPSPCMLALPGIPCHAYLPGEFPNHPSRFSSAITSSVKPSQLSPSRAGHPSSVVHCPFFHAAAPALTTPVLVCLDI